VAEALETLFPDREEQVGLLARHWEHARDAEKAAEYLLRAGDQARLAYAHDEAIAYYQRALAFLHEEEDSERAARTMMKLGLTYHNALRFRETRAAYDEGFRFWQRAGEVEPAQVPPAPHALRVHRYHTPAELDPARVAQRDAADVLHQLFSGLVELTPGLDVVPDIARSWEVSESGRRYVFHLREDAVWSDGVPLTAQDFEYAWKRVLDPATNAATAEQLYILKGAKTFHRGESAVSDDVGVKAMDDATLVVDLEEPTGHFLQMLGDFRFRPVPRHIVQAHGEAWTDPGRLVSNGPFRLESWQPAESMVLVRSPTYRGRFLGNVQRLELMSCGWEDQFNWTIPLELYEADELDTLDIEYFPPTQINRLRQRLADEYMSIPSPGSYSLVCDTSRPPFDDRRVRRAFAQAADKERLMNEVLPDWGFPATGGLVPPGIPGHSPGIGLPYDLERAHQLLAQAGFPGGRGFPPVDLPTPGNPLELAVNESVQAEWQSNLGVTVSWRVGGKMETEAYQGRSSHLRWWGWASSTLHPDDMLSNMPAFVGWRNAEYERLITQARNATDQAGQLKLYAHADRMLVEEAAIIPFCYGRRHLLFKPWLRRLSQSVASSSWWWTEVIIEPH
jgi:oligopeptide transport system substrate-binding protein